MLEEARIQICLEEWLLKLDVVKQDIENRERLYSEFTREKKNWSNLLQKTEQKKLIEDPATIAKLNKLESNWQAAQEGFKRTNQKIIFSVSELQAQVKPALEQCIGSLGVAQYGLYHTLNMAYAEWQEEDPLFEPSIIPAHVKSSAKVVPAATTTPLASENNDNKASAGSESEPSPPTPPPKPQTVPPPIPSRRTGIYARQSVKPLPAKPRAPIMKPLPKPPVAQSESGMAPSSLSVPKSDTILHRLDEQELLELSKQREQLGREWRELEAAQLQFQKRQREEAEALKKEKQALEGSRQEKFGLMRRAQKQLEEERLLLEDTKREVEEKLKIAEAREQARQQIEQEFLQMQAERRQLEDKKRQMRERKLQLKIEEEWKKIEEARKEILHLRQAEHARSLEAQAEILRAEKESFAEEEKKRVQREEALIQEEVKEHERTLRIQHQNESERRKLEQSLRSLRTQLDDDDSMITFSPKFFPPGEQQVSHPDRSTEVVMEQETNASQSSEALEGGEEHHFDEEKEEEEANTSQIDEALEGEEKHHYEEEKTEEANTSQIDGALEEEEEEEKVEKEASPNQSNKALEGEKEHQEDNEEEQEAEDKKGNVNQRNEDVGEGKEIVTPNGEAEESLSAREGGTENTKNPDHGENRYVVVREFLAGEEEELTLRLGDKVQLLDGGAEDQWWLGRLLSPDCDSMGIFPRSAVKPATSDGGPS